MHIEQDFPGQYRRFQREFVYLPEVLRAQFTLEFDVYPVKTKPKSSFRFGLGTDLHDSQKGPLIIGELNNQNSDTAFSVVAISQENLRSQTISIPGKSNYNGKTVKFSDGSGYHIRLTWYPVDKRVSMTVTVPGEDKPIFSHFVTVTGKMEELTDLFMTSTGEGQSGMKAEGFIDNITLTALTSIPASPQPTNTPTELTPTPTLVIETQEEPVEESTPQVVIPARTPLPAPPTPTPTQKSGLGPFTGMAALMTIGLLFVFRR